MGSSRIASEYDRLVVFLERNIGQPAIDVGVNEVAVEPQGLRIDIDCVAEFSLADQGHSFPSERARVVEAHAPRVVEVGKGQIEFVLVIPADAAAEIGVGHFRVQADRFGEREDPFVIAVEHPVSDAQGVVSARCIARGRQFDRFLERVDRLLVLAGVEQVLSLLEFRLTGGRRRLGRFEVARLVERRHVGLGRLRVGGRLRRGLGRRLDGRLTRRLNRGRVFVGFVSKRVALLGLAGPGRPGCVGQQAGRCCFRVVRFFGRRRGDRIVGPLGAGVLVFCRRVGLRRGFVLGGRLLIGRVGKRIVFGRPTEADKLRADKDRGDSPRRSAQH